MSSSNDNEIPTCSNGAIELAAQRRARTAGKAKFTRFSNQLMNLIEDIDDPKGVEVEEAHSKLKSSFDELVDLSISFSEKLDERGETALSDKVLQDVEDLTERFDKIETQYRVRINTKKKEASMIEARSRVESWVEEQREEENIEIVQEVQPALASAPLELGRDMWRQLERVAVPKFNGNKHSYPSWKAAFNACIDSAPATAEYKLLQLRQSLIGEPLRVVENLGHSKEAYEVAKQCLERKYGGQRRLVSLHLDELDHFKPLKDGHAKALETFADLLDVTIVNLKQAKMDNELGCGALYIKLQRKFSENLLTNYRRWLIDYKKEECVLSLHEFVLREAEFLAIASETLNGIASKRTEKAADRQRTFYGKTQLNYSTLRCLLCFKNHVFSKCPEFHEMNIHDRWKSVKRLNLCFGCLGKNHALQNCKKARKCENKNCSKFHHPMLHKTEVRQQETEHTRPDHQRMSNTATEDVSRETASFSTANAENNRTMVSKSKPGDSIAMRTIPVILEHNSKQLQVNALLDDCSTKTYVNADVAAELGLEGKSEFINVGVLNGGYEKFETQPVNLLLKSLDGDVTKEITAYTANDVTGDLKALPWEEIKQKWSYLSKIPFPKVKSRHVDMLIGLDYLELHKCVREICGPPGAPVARLTPLGWTCTGLLQRGTDDTAYISYFTKSSDQNKMLRSIDQSLQKFWEIETYENTESTIVKSQDKEAISIVERSIEWVENRYEVPIPWKLNPEILPSSYEMASRRLCNMEKRLLKNSSLASSYSNVINAYENKGYISKVKNVFCSDPQQWFLPHFPVLRPDKATTKVRVVFDASAKCDGICLNDVIAVGPKLQRELVDVLLRFRRGAVALVCDIAEMYLQIGVAKQDKKYLRFLWRGLDQSRPPDVFEFNRIVFGLNASPFLAQFVTQHHASKFASVLPRAATTLEKSTYMDDCMDSVDTECEGIELYHDLCALWKSAGMHARKWASNSVAVAQKIPDEDKAIAFDVHDEDHNSIKTLGLWWKAESDTFEFKSIIPVNDKITKRIWLSKISTLFDPLGFITPYTIRARILVQEIWAKGHDWDEIVQDDISKACLTWLEELPQLETIKVPRWLGMSNSVNLTELHIFVDASSLAYGAVCYVKTNKTSGKTTTCLVCSKVKVAPLKTVTIPRLELMAATLGVKMGQTVARVLNIPLRDFNFWTDSTNVLWWIRGCSRSFKTFVANRVGKIQSCTNPSQWRHVKSSENPADLLSRGSDALTLQSNDLWWYGPRFILLEKSDWPETSLIPIESETKSKKISFLTCQKEEAAKADDIDRGCLWKLAPERFSDWLKYVRLYALVVRFVENCRQQISQRKYGELTAEELTDAETRILMTTQKEAFPLEYDALRKEREIPNKSALLKLNPKLWLDGLIRCDGRLKFAEYLPFSARCPIVLPRKSWVTLLVVKHFHEQVEHHGVNHTLAAISAKYWILYAREVIKEWQNQCAKCKKTRAKLGVQVMAPLPDNRLQVPIRAFARVAVDFAGPFITIQGRGRKRQKRYLCLFTCLACRAVHLEMAYGLDTDAFLKAFFRMVNRRGYPIEVVSDNAGNFTAAEKELKDLSSKIDNRKVQSCFANHNIKWSFIPPLAPHFGGVHEAMIKAAKRAFKAILQSADVTDEELQSAFIGAESLINSRPLTYQSADASDDPPLTPNHFLIGQLGGAYAPEIGDHASSNPAKRWRRIQELIRHYWARWLKEWIPALNARPKWRINRNNIKPNEVVLVLSANTPRAHWPMGRVIRVHPGRDGRVRVVTIQTGSGVLTRPITQICPLEI